MSSVITSHPKGKNTMMTQCERLRKYLQSQMLRKTWHKEAVYLGYVAQTCER